MDEPEPEPRCPSCGGRTEIAEGMKVLSRNASDGRRWTREELDRETVLRCLHCRLLFSERHYRRARDSGELPPPPA